jgi:hypothetical protein
MIDLQNRTTPQETTRIEGRTKDLHIEMIKGVQMSNTYRTIGYMTT